MVKAKSSKRATPKTPAKKSGRKPNPEPEKPEVKKTRVEQIASNIAWSEYIKQIPTAKQLAFCLIPQKEALFGGAAGPGKSSALLMAALQYATYPGYAALILRKTFQDLKLPGALIDRSHDWLRDTPAEWKAQEHSWYFPTVYPDGSPGEPARLQFGFIGESSARSRYQSAEFQFIGIDEATLIPQVDYEFMFSRLRRTACPIHKTVNGEPVYDEKCPKCQVRRAIPLRFRAASNPGGLSHAFIKRRFDIGPHMNEVEAKQKGIPLRFIGRNPDRPYLPAFLTDNPHILQAEYADSLSNLDPITREQLLKGDWGVSPESRFKRHWIKYYSYRGPYLSLGEDGNGPVHTIQSLKTVFLTVDPAGSSREGPGDDVIHGNEPSWTVICAWGITEDFNLLLFDMERFRREIPDVQVAIESMYRKWKCRYACIEGNGLGRGIYQTAMRDGLIVKPVFRDTDKVVNATEAILLMSSGRIWIPQSHPKLEEWCDEVFTWMGDPSQTDDIVDTLSDAAKEVALYGDASGLNSSYTAPQGRRENLPGFSDSRIGTIAVTTNGTQGFLGYGVAGI